jgi:hypothetical protein
LLVVSDFLANEQLMALTGVSHVLQEQWDLETLANNNQKQTTKNNQKQPKTKNKGGEMKNGQNKRK